MAGISSDEVHYVNAFSGGVVPDAVVTAPVKSPSTSSAFSPSSSRKRYLLAQCGPCVAACGFGSKSVEIHRACDSPLQYSLDLEHYCALCPSAGIAGIAWASPSLLLVAAQGCIFVVPMGGKRPLVQQIFLNGATPKILTFRTKFAPSWDFWSKIKNFAPILVANKRTAAVISGREVVVISIGSGQIIQRL